MWTLAYLLRRVYEKEYLNNSHFFQGFLDGAIGQFLAPGEIYPLSTVPMLILGTFLVFTWYIEDAREVRYKRSVFLNISVVALAAVALPYYFFRSRGVKVGFKYTALLIVSILIWILLQSVGIFSVSILQQS